MVFRHEQTEWWHWVRLACLTWWSRGLRWWFGAGKLAGRLAFVSPDGTPGCSGELCTLPVSEFSSSACTETADLKLPPRGVKFCQITTPKTWYSIILALPHGPQKQGLGDKLTIILIIFWTQTNYIVDWLAESESHFLGHTIGIMRPINNLYTTVT